MKIFRVTLYPTDYNPKTNCEITDVTPVLNHVKHFKGSIDYFYGESPTHNPEWYSVQVKSNGVETAKEKGMKIIEKHREVK
jgi:hypothetical protein